MTVADIALSLEAGAIQSLSADWSKGKMVLGERPSAYPAADSCGDPGCLSLGCIRGMRERLAAAAGCGSSAPEIAGLGSAIGKVAAGEAVLRFGSRGGVPPAGRIVDRSRH